MLSSRANRAGHRDSNSIMRKCYDAYCTVKENGIAMVVIIYDSHLILVDHGGKCRGVNVPVAMREITSCTIKRSHQNTLPKTLQPTTNDDSTWTIILHMSILQSVSGS